MSDGSVDSAVEAPEAEKGAFSVAGDFTTEGVQFDAFRKARPTTKASN